MILRRLTVPEGTVEHLRQMERNGVSLEEMIAFLASRGISKAIASLSFRLAKVRPFNEVKITLHFSKAYEARRVSDEAFQASALAVMDELVVQERSRSAAA